MAGEAVWCVWVGGHWRRKGWETSGSQAPTKTDNEGGQTASPAWAGTAQGSERSRDVRAGYDGEREQALTCEEKYTASTLMRAFRRSLWRTCSDTVCANSAGALYPGCPEGFVRRSRQGGDSQGLEE